MERYSHQVEHGLSRHSLQVRLTAVPHSLWDGSETSQMYPEMARVAREEGFDEIVRMFERIGSVQAAHRDRDKALLKNLADKTVFRKDKKVVWRCRNCGHIWEGPKAPEQCPVCKHPQAFFEVAATNY